ncbi:MAG: hypothetical protein ACFE8M_03330 [Candidatus Hermodarchaeota archaeon]
MDSIWGYLLFVGIILILIFILIYYRKKKIKKNKKPRKEDSTSKFKSLDGHIVRSKGELIIDNYLYILGFDHIYEKKIKILKKSVKCDWYLPDYDIYIEYWGFHGKSYLKRKKEKINLYKEAKLKLISIENYMFTDIYTNLNKNLKRYINIKRFQYPNGLKRYCFNCGIVLDDRF